MKVEASADVSDIVETLEGVAERAADLSDAWNKVGEMWVKRQKALFTQGGRLAPLKPSTVKRKGGNATPLVNTGKLSLATYKRTPVKIDDKSVSFGIPKGESIRKLAILHQTGRQTMAKRNPVPNLRAAEKKQIVELLRGHVLGDEA